MDTVLETNKDSFNILFIQEPPWRTIRQAPSTRDPNGEPVVGGPIHPEWTPIVRYSPDNEDTCPRVMAFIHSRLQRLRPAYRRDLVDHRDIQVISLYSQGECVYLMNVYSDSHREAITFLTNEFVEFPGLLYMGGDFNVRSAEWDPTVRSVPPEADVLTDLADSFGLERSIPENPGAHVLFIQS
ncbi:hypothetical protein NP233_g10444 [Leucocoprinus birnbaumii]|uniref:Endonuclease/exonuclease/phosphatase domain-containing protein n=1 Tax=Leucocoprinus birnbaumii TaxID=56174 RepID=A0AAD5VM17_9AGAR|nr:hypothetical protein NP233_g10444 [Leucocoprinus birnbaumii]